MKNHRLLVTLALSLSFSGSISWAQQTLVPIEKPVSPFSEESIKIAQNSTTSPAAPPSQSSESSTGTPTAPAQPSEAPPPAPEVPKDEKAVEKALQAPSEVRHATTTEAEQAQVLLGESRLQLEISETYAHFSGNQLFIDGFSILPVLIIGPIKIEKIRRDIFISTLAARYKLTANLQLEVRIPYQYTFSRSSQAAGTQTGTANPSEETFASSSGLGDVEGSLSYQVLKERLGWPALLVGLGFKARTGRDFFATADPTNNPPTGSGYNSAIGTVSVVKTADPAVLFSSLSYVYSIARRNVVFRPPEEDPRLINYSPGDSVRFGAGVAYALNYRLTMSFQYQHAITFPTRIDGKKSPNSFANSASIRIGAVWRVNDKFSIDLGVSPGLTMDAPDMRVDLRFPYRF